MRTIQPTECTDAGRGDPLAELPVSSRSSLGFGLENDLKRSDCSRLSVEGLWPDFLSPPLICCDLTSGLTCALFSVCDKGFVAKVLCSAGAAPVVGALPLSCDLLSGFLRVLAATCGTAMGTCRFPILRYTIIQPQTFVIEFG